MNKKCKKTKYHGESILSYFISVQSNENHSTLGKPTLETISPPVQKAPKTVTETRKCPFYKWIPGTRITVDAFNYGQILGCDHYFLSHFHYDHYRGLKSSFQGRIYCSKVTEGFVRATFGQKLDIVVLELNETKLVDDVEVIALDANHCPGSVMFLFHIPSNKRSYLHTGDFRYTPAMLDVFKNTTDTNPLAKFIRNDSNSAKIHTLFLDTTYCSAQYDFIPQVKLIQGAIQVTKEYLGKDPSALVVCGMYTIGKERFVHGIASELNLKIWLPKQQSRLVKIAADKGCPICKKMIHLTVTDPGLAQLHILPMQQINMANLIKYRNNLKPIAPIDPFSATPVKSTDGQRGVIAWRPTGWTHKPSRRSSGAFQTSLVESSLPEGISQETSCNNIFIFGAAYSEHSSFEELREFVTRLCPTRIQPTVFGKSFQTCLDTVNGWLKEASGS